MAFLVKGKGPAARGRFALGPAGANIHFSAEPLFRSIGAAGRLGAAPSGSQWFRVTADAGADSVNPWDACHALMAQGYSGRGAGPLESGIAENGWLTCPATSELLVDTDLHRKNDRILATRGLDLARLSSAAGHA